jgi:ribonucleoside-triphosphate reductase
MTKVAKIIKRDGTKKRFQKSKIYKALESSFYEYDESYDEELYNKITKEILEDIQDKSKNGEITAELVALCITDILYKNNLNNIAEKYIIHRYNKLTAKNINVNIKNLTDNYLYMKDWRLKENSNFNYSVGGLEFYQSGAINARYWLDVVYPKRISEAHINGDIHIGDLSRITIYCGGFEISKLLKEGFKGVGNNLSSKPAKHLRSIINQLINFIGVMSNEFAGAIAINNFSTMLAPFIKKDNLCYDEILQNIQNFVFSVNIPSRFSCQSLTYDQNIIMFDKNDVMKNIQIGDFVENYNNYKEYKVLSMNTKTGEITKNKVTGTIKHNTENEIYKIKLFGGNEINVTENHSLFSINENLDIVENIPSESLKHILVSKKYIDNNESDKLLNITFPSNLGTKNKGLKLEVDEKIGWLLGLYVADGSISGSSISIASYNKNLFNSIKEITETFTKIKDKAHEKQKEKECGDISLGVGRNVSYTIREMCGHNAHFKKIPEIILKSKKSVQLAFLSGLIDGDGYIDIKHNCPIIDTVSKDLVTGIVYLCTKVGIETSVKEIIRGKNSFKPNRKHYNIYILSNKRNLLLCKHPKKFKDIQNLNYPIKDFRHDYSFLNKTLSQLFCSSHISKYSFIGYHKISNKDIDKLREHVKLSLNKILTTDFNNKQQLVSLLDFLYIPRFKKNSFNTTTFLTTNLPEIFNKHLTMIKKEIEIKKTLLLKLNNILIILENVEPIKVHYIKKTDYEKHVYDISVENNQNFVTWNGIIAHNSPFSNITLDLSVPLEIKNKKAILGGKEQDFTYGDCLEEMKLINKAFFEVMLEGDADGRPFSFPIPTINIDKDFNWDEAYLETMWKATGKYGYFYFANYINSNLNSSDARSLCCRLKINTKEILARSSGLLGGTGFLNTGSIGVCTINLPRIAYLSKNKKEFKKTLDEKLEVAYDSLEIKRKILNSNLQNNLYPYSKWYLENLNNHFSTIGINGMHEACLNLIKEGIETEKGKDFATEIMDFVNFKVNEFKTRSGNLYNHEQVPGEGLSTRLAQIDKKKYPEIIVSGDNENIYYTSSTLLPSYKLDDIFFSLEHQNDIQKMFDGGCLRKGTKVLTRQGRMNIEDIVNKTNKGEIVEVLSFNNTDKKEEWKKVKKGFVNDVSKNKKYRITTEGNINIETTDKHKYFVIEKEKFNNVCPICQKSVKNIKAFSSHIRFNKNCKENYVKNNEFVIKEKRTDELKLKDHIIQPSTNVIRDIKENDYDSELMWLIGFFIGDGCISKYIDNRGHNNLIKHTIRFFTSDKQVINKTRTIINKYFDTNISVQPKKKGCYIVSCSKKNATDFFINNGFCVGKKCYDIKIPAKIKEKINKENIFYLLSGLADSDGHINKRDGDFDYYSVSETLIDELIDLCSMAGITIRKYIRYTKRLNEKTIYKFTIPTYEMYKIQKNMNFLHNKNQTKSSIVKYKKEINRKHVVFVKKIQEIQTENLFYDIEVEDNNNYYAGNNGYLLVHNSVFHLYLGESIDNSEMVKSLVKKICTNYELPYISLTPTYSICPNHGFIGSEFFKCPKCGSECQVFSRVVGYYRPVQNYNIGKRREYNDRKKFTKYQIEELNEKR